MKHLRYALASLLALSLFAAPSGEAQANRSEARAAFKKGRGLFKQGKFEQAAVELEKAYRLSPHPALLRYLGQTYYKANKPKKALEHFERYLAQAPQAPDRARTEAKIAELKKILAAAKAAPDGAKPNKPNKPNKPGPTIDLRPTGEDTEMPSVFEKPKPGEETSGGLRFITIAKWTSVGLAAAGLAMGVTFNVMANTKATELEDAAVANNPDKNNPTTSFSKSHFDLQQAYKRNNTVAIISYITGGVFTAAAVTLFIVDGGKKPERQGKTSRSDVAIAPAIGPGHYGLSTTITF
ncbi:MAG: hypothetical protein CSB49_06230 [Proteobacteria bacterium]|nr:MAG: hypothetical protein CSB49_06230 [Pseudomonadota bacterium]